MQIAAGNSIVSYRLSGVPARPDRPRVVFLHGWGRTMTDFEALGQELGRRLPEAVFLAVDLPGFGGSPLQGTQGFGLDEYVEALGRILEKLGISRVILVGHSFGGRIAIAFAATYPGRVEKIVLIAAAGIRHPSTRSALLAMGRALFRGIFFAFRDLAFVLRLEHLLGVIFGSSDYRHARGALRETFRKTFAVDMRPYAAKIRAPTLLLWGRQDEVIPVGDGQTYARIITGARLEILEGGHFIFHDAPVASAGLIASFLGQHA